MSELILQSLFDELPGNGQAKEENAELALWQRMATDLDEIAANTRHGSIGSAKAQSAKRKSTPKQGQPETATPRTQKAVRPVSQNPVVTARSSSPGIESSLTKAAAQRQGQAVAKAVKTALDNAGISQGRGGRKQARDSRGRFVRQPQGGEATPAPTRSEVAQQRQRERQREASAQNGGIATALRSGFNSLTGLLGKTVKSVTEDNDAKDAAGFAVGGPAWAAYKEIKQAIPDSIKDALSKKDGEKKLEKPQEDKNTGVTRNEKGQFATAKTQARQQEAQRELAEDNLALDEREAKKNAKRHKELVRAVRDNKRGMMDRMLDRMAFGGGLPGFGKGGRLGRGGLLGRVGRAGAGAAGTIATVGGAAAKAGGGILGKAGGVARAGGGILAKAGGLAGKGLLNAAKVIPVAGQLLAAGMAIYDGFNGWNDKDLHKQAFGLKDGQEATTGQKASAAIANVLDLGGLGTGLLGMLGIDVNTADIARGLYDFGSTVSNLASEAKTQIAALLPDVWKGIRGIGEKALAGAQELGTTLSNFAQSTFAEGEKILGDMWKGVSCFAGKLWSDLTNFASNAIADAGKLLEGLWKDVKELPGKLADGAANLATSAVEKGGALISGAADTVKGWFGFGDKKESPAPIAQEATSAPSDTGILTSAAGVAGSVWDKGKQIVKEKMKGAQRIREAQNANTQATNEALGGALAPIAYLKDMSTKAHRAVGEYMGVEYDAPKQDNEGIAGNLTRVAEARNQNMHAMNEATGGLLTPFVKLNDWQLEIREGIKNFIVDMFSVREAHAGDLTPEVLAKYQAEDAKKNVATPATETQERAHIIQFPETPGTSLADKTQQAAREEKLNETLEDLVFITNKQVKLLEDEAADRMAKQQTLEEEREAGGGDTSTGAQFDTGTGVAGGTYQTTTVGGVALATDGVNAPQNVPLLGADKRGIRNNNPGNLKSSNEHWEGEIASTDGVHKQFSHPEYGIRAMAKLISNYRTKHGIKTLQDFTTRYAPSSDKNNPVEYAKFLSKQLGGVGVNQEIDFTDPKILKAMTIGVIKQENSVNPYSDEQITRGVNAALGLEKLDQATLGGVAVQSVQGVPNMPAAPMVADPTSSSALFSQVAAQNQQAWNHVKYGNANRGNIALSATKPDAQNRLGRFVDCSGWTGKNAFDVMQATNSMLGTNAYDTGFMNKFRSANSYGQVAMLREQAQKNGGRLVSHEDFMNGNVQEGDILQIGNGHVAYAYKDPKRGMMISESADGWSDDQGVRAMPVSGYRRYVQKRGYKVQGANLTAAMSQENRTALAALEGKNVNAAVAEAATTPVVAREPVNAGPAMPATMAQIGNRQAPMPNIEPQVVVEQDNSQQQAFNAQTLKILQRMLAALEAGNKIQQSAAANNSGDGVPSIPTDFDSAAANSLASDAA